MKGDLLSTLLCIWAISESLSLKASDSDAEVNGYEALIPKADKEFDDPYKVGEFHIYLKRRGDEAKAKTKHELIYFVSLSDCEGISVFQHKICKRDQQEVKEQI